MNDSARELELIRAQLRVAIERDLHRSPRLRVTHRRSFRLAIPTLAVFAAATAVVLALTLSASPESASAAARRALAATAAAPSGTMTTTMLHAGVTHTLETSRWNGGDIAWSPGFGSVFAAPDGSIEQVLLIGGGMYVQTHVGTWLHYAKASEVAPKPLGGMVGLARNSIESTSAQQILTLATHVQKTAQPDGTTLYAGTIPYSSLDPASMPGNDPITSMILGAQKSTDLMSGAGSRNEQPAPGDLQLQMNVGGEGLVKEVSVTFQQAGTGSPAVDGTYTWSVTYTRLGSTPPIAAPASSTDVAPGTLPPGMPQPNTQQQNPQPPPITSADRLDYLKAAACMRAHGIPDFPDPTFGNNTVTFDIPPNIDPNSSQAQSAEATCVKLIPPGLPYSHRAS
jgi:hypothetical protein